MGKVYVGAVYFYEPVGLDRCDPPPGVLAGDLEEGDLVMVKDEVGCPRANTMGHCYIRSTDGEKFHGLVHCNSLVKVKGLKS